MNLVPWTYKQPFRFTLSPETSQLVLPSPFTAFSYDSIINLFSVTAVLYFKPLPSRVRDWLNRLSFEFIVRILYCDWLFCLSDLGQCSRTVSPFICTQPLLDSCHIEGKYCSRIHCTLAACISFCVLLGIVRTVSDRFVCVCGTLLRLGLE